QRRLAVLTIPKSDVTRRNVEISSEDFPEGRPRGDKPVAIPVEAEPLRPGPLVRGKAHELIKPHVPSAVQGDSPDVDFAPRKADSRERPRDSGFGRHPDEDFAMLGSGWAMPPSSFSHPRRRASSSRASVMTCGSEMTLL